MIYHSNDKRVELKNGIIEYTCYQLSDKLRKTKDFFFVTIRKGYHRALLGMYLYKNKLSESQNCFQNFT